MKRKRRLLLLSTLVFVPFIIVVVLLYGSTSIPIGTFRSIEKENVAAEKKNAAAYSENPANRLRKPQPKHDDIVQAPTNITSIKPNGTVHVNNLAWLEALFNIVGYGVGMALITIGLCYGIYIACRNRHHGMQKIRLPLAIMVIGMVIPTAVSLLFAALSQTNFFN